jgi:large subunit ribosomal protein L25
MVQLDLTADSRVITGKAVRSLRRSGLTPLHLFGGGVESLALQAETAKVEKSLAQAGETRVISLTVSGERKARAVLVRGIERDPISRALLHVDLFQVKLDEKLEAEVPIVLVGEDAALHSKGATVLQQLNALTVECLPDSIPSSVEVDISSLAGAGQVKRVKDIVVAPNVTVVNDPEQVIAIVVARLEEKEPAKPATEAPAESPTETRPAAEHKAEA